MNIDLVIYEKNMNKDLLINEIKSGEFVINNDKQLRTVIDNHLQIHYIKKIYADLLNQPSLNSEFIKNTFEWINLFECKNKELIKADKHISWIYKELVSSYFKNYGYKYINRNEI